MYIHTNKHEKKKICMYKQKAINLLLYNFGTLIMNTCVIMVKL
uniref:Uncharacterized protein n=1 Tax=Arundo donax TaxID=35708 RepID=A0A0A9HC23_ARUDO